MNGKKTPSLAKLDEMIDEIVYELMGYKTPSQMLSENKANPTPNSQYGLLAYPPSYSPSVQMLKGLIKEEVARIKFRQSIGYKINSLAYSVGVLNEFKDKITELNRRLTMNDLGGYSGWEVANDRQQSIFALNLVPEDFPEMLTSIEEYVDGGGFIYRWGSNHERDEFQHLCPVLWKQIDDLFRKQGED